MRGLVDFSIKVITEFRHTFSIFQIVDNFSTLTHSSFPKHKLSVVPEIKVPALYTNPQISRIKFYKEQ